MRNTNYAMSRLSIKAVADAAHGQDAFRLGRICFDLLAQPANVNVDRAAAPVKIPAPHAFQNQAASQGDAPIAGEEGEQLKLLWL